MAAGQRTAPEVEAQVIEPVKAGKTRREVSQATGVSARVITRIVRDTPGVEFAMNGTAQPFFPRNFFPNAVGSIPASSATAPESGPLSHRLARTNSRLPSPS